MNNWQTIARHLIHGLRLIPLALYLLMGGCAGGSSQGERESPTNGTIHISVDESFRPVIDSQIQVFESLNPHARIIVHYKSEADCLRDLQSDSIRMVIVTRGLTEGEQQVLKDSLRFAPTYGIMAWDALAVVVNVNAPDSLFTRAEIASMAKGISGYPYKLILDGKNATSAVRFLTDSLLEGKAPGNKVEGATGSAAVLDYIATHTDALGLVGVSWIGNQDDPDQQSFLEKVRIAALECRGCENGPYVKPYQANIYTGRYPLLRPLYYILKENYDGLGSGFRNFLTLEKGQRIFKRAYLLPARMSFEVQNMDIKQ